MLKKARVIVTVHRNPVQPVAMDAAPASNIHFGEMTAAHARRDRRKARLRRSRNRRTRTIVRFS
jgi:hypothetical protein